MNKEEIEHELARARAAETTIKNNIIELLEQLVEAEKPKLRHGDFGIVNRKGFYLNDSSRTKVKPINMPVFEYENQSYDSYHSDYDNREVVFGNIFDLMKDWGKDLEEWESKPAYQDAIQIIMEVKFNGIFFGNSGNAATFDLESITEIWRKLGQEIATLKRKSSQE